ncbi:sucrose synthase [Fagus crenata]
MAERVLTRVHSLRERLDETLAANRNEIVSLLSRIEGKGKGILQHHQLIAELEAIPEANRKKLLDGAFVRPRPGVWEYIRVNVHALVVEELRVPEYLHFKEEVTHCLLGFNASTNGNFVLELDFEPFSASFPRPTLSKYIGNGIEFLNRHLSAKLSMTRRACILCLNFSEFTATRGRSDALSKPSHSGRSSCDSEIQLYNVDELQSDGPSLKECNLGDETGSIGSCTKNNKANPSRFQLEQDAAYTLGGHSFTAAAIEYVILKVKPPLHRPQIALLLALHKLKVSDEQLKSAVDTYEPLVAFALSCGMYTLHPR